MAAKIDEESGLIHHDETTTSHLNILDNTYNMESQSDGCRRKLLSLGKLVLFLGCLAYNLYLIWLVAYLKDNAYYWFLSLIPLCHNLTVPLLGIYLKKAMKRDDIPDANILKFCIFGVIIILMACFTMLTRVAYYHRQPDQFIGPRFIISSLEGSVILIMLGCFVIREGKLKEMLDLKDILNRMLLDFVDIFNMIQILSADECAGIGSSVSEGSATEKAIQAFCTISFFLLGCIVHLPDLLQPTRKLQGENSGDSDVFKSEILYVLVLVYSCLFQNIAFLVIRIVVWVRYNFFNLGFLVKNTMVIFYFIVICINNCNLRQQKIIIKPYKHYEVEEKMETRGFRKGDCLAFQTRKRASSAPLLQATSQPPQLEKCSTVPV